MLALVLTLASLTGPAELPPPAVARSGVRELVESGGLDRIELRVDGELVASTQRSVGTMPGVVVPVDVTPSASVYSSSWNSNGAVIELVTHKNPLSSTNYHAWVHKNFVHSAMGASPPTAVWGDTTPAADVAHEPGSPMVTEWTSHGGVLHHRVTTPPDPEDPNDTTTQAAQHARAVASLMEHFPGDEPGGD